VGSFAAQIRALAKHNHNDLALRYHYSHMARTNAGDRLAAGQVKLKKYFYILRPLLAIKYIEAGLGLPPVRFQELIESVAPLDIRESIYSLIALKRNTPEIGLGDAVPVLNDFIFAELGRHEGVLSGEGRPVMHDKLVLRDKLNVVFKKDIRRSMLVPLFGSESDIVA